MDALKAKMLIPASTMLGAQQQSADAVRECSLQVYGALLDANLLVTGAIASALIRANGKIAEVKSGSTVRDALLASFIMGHGFCEKAISEGYYPQASALLRQELETIAALEEVKKGVRKSGTNPNTRHVPWSLSKLYGDLSAATHVANHKILRSMVELRGSVPEDTVVWRMYPELNPELSRRLYAVHTMLMIQLSVHLDEAHMEQHGIGFDQDGEEAISLAVEVLVREKCLERGA